MVDNVVFDNFLITSDQSIAKQYADQIWYPKSILEGKAISSASESVVDAIVNATKNRPWLWAVYLVAILLPLIILFVFCWSRKSTKKSTNVGLKKKTDEVEQDSNEQQVLTRTDDDDEETEEIEIDEQQIKHTVTTGTGKDALENEEEEQQQEEEVEVNVRNFFCILFNLYSFVFLRLPNQLKMKVI
jgi:calnexin